MSTSIAIIRTEQVIVVAADSAAVDENGRPAGSPECKIRPIGNFFYVPNKFTEDSAGGYNLHRIIEKNGQRESLDALAAVLRDQIAEPLIRAITLARQRNPMRFKENFKTLQAVGVAFVGVELGRPSLIDLKFYIEDLEAKTIRLRVEERRCPGADCPNGAAAVLVGPEYLKLRFEREHPGYTTGSVDDLAKNAEAFVQMAIDERLPDVAPPISVLVIRPDGLEWRKGKPCKAESDE